MPTTRIRSLHQRLTVISDFPPAQSRPGTSKNLLRRTMPRYDRTRNQHKRMFPSLLMEAKSEASRGTLYSAECLLANAGAHRVNSMMWVLRRGEPSGTHSSADAVVFSAAVTQRETIAYVHYYKYGKRAVLHVLRSYFPIRDGYSGSHDYSKKIVDWLGEV
ncbi:hypothetical protein B0O99DRAFT_689020 [Bisporella sp. PMI_857]|nr:hypothetical protein B0O99DRAFT_689020 [Bisporella sp. PMI_857]